MVETLTTFDVPRPAASSRPAAPALLLVLAVALLAQWLLWRGVSWIDGLLLYAVAALLLIRFLVAHEPTPALPSPSPEEGVREAAEEPRRWAHQARFVCAFLALSAFLGMGGNNVGLAAVTSLAGAVAAYLYLFWHSRSEPWEIRRWARDWMAPGGLRFSVSWTGVALALVLLVGIFFRFYQLPTLPEEMISDHPEKFLDIETIQGGARPIFFPRNAGREGTQFYFAAAMASVTGYTYLTLKLVTVAASLAAIVPVFLLGRMLFGVGVGVAAAFLVAISKWDISVARFATRATFGELWSAVALYLAYRALIGRDRNLFLALGLAMGLGLYGYTSFRIVPIFVALLVAAFCVFDPAIGAQRRSILRWAVRSYGLMGLLAIPLVRYAVDYPQDFFFRSATRLTEAETSIVGTPFAIFLGNLWNMLLMFNWKGDRSWLEQVPGEPSLDWVTGALFVLGVVYAAYRAISHREIVPATLVAGVLVLTLPSTLALAFPIENPHLSRGNPVIPVVMVLAALPLQLAQRHLGGALMVARGRLMLGAGVGALGLVAAVANFQSYFQDYAQVHRINSHNQKEVAAVIHGFAELTGSDRNAFLPVWPFWIDHRIVALELGDFAWKDTALVERIEDAALQAQTPGPKLYVLHKDDAADLAALRRIYPQAIVREHRSAKPGRDFRSVFVPG